MPQITPQTLSSPLVSPQQQTMLSDSTPNSNLQNKTASAWCLCCKWLCFWYPCEIYTIIPSDSQTPTNISTPNLPCGCCCCACCYGAIIYLNGESGAVETYDPLKYQINVLQVFGQLKRIY